MVGRNRKVSIKNVERKKKKCQRTRMVPDDRNQERRFWFFLPRIFFLQIDRKWARKVNTAEI